ncbi:MAG: hypothetical protein WAW07_00135 [Bacteroidales bacterium]
MVRKFIILGMLLLLLPPGRLLSQAKPIFSGDPSKFKDELMTFMGPDISEKNSAILNTFIAKWDSSAFSKENMTMILDLSSQLTGRQMRANPHFSQFLKTLTDFSTYKRDDSFLSYWLTGLSEMLFNPRIRNESLIRYIENTSLIIEENLLINTGSVRWKVKDAEIKFTHDTSFHILLNDITLTCYSQRDSTEIYNASGIFYPDLQEFHGTKGTITWEKAGYPRDEVSAEISDYVIDITRNTFSCDSARLTHKSWFSQPVYGLLTDQASTIISKEKATYPQFKTYTSQFRIKNLYKGLEYHGGLLFEGALVKGKGEKAFPAMISLFRRDTLFINVAANDFVFSASGINSQETEATIYLGQDSIYHTNLGFSFNGKIRRVNLFRTNNPVSQSPYYNTWHDVDMYLENLSWNMDDKNVIISRPMGAAMGQAIFESSTFFDSNDFLKLMNLDNEHPLTRLKKFSEWYYSETFPVSEFAKWLKKSEEYVTGLCIDMAKKGFIFYDPANQEVTIKQKTKDYIDSYAGKKDYDVISIFSETKAPVDNAVLDLDDFNITINGVESIFISDSQKVAIFPSNKQVILGKNKQVKFDGVVLAGLFTFFGKNFQFSYDTFKINLQSIDSIQMAVETEKLDEYGKAIALYINSVVELGSAQLYIDDPLNKSGLKSLPQYPIVNSTASSYIFYDKIDGLEGVYKRDDFYFRIDPFTFENIDHYSSSELRLTGKFYGGNIIEPSKQYLTVQENNSLGFQMIIPKEGLKIYSGNAVLFDQIHMSNKGLIGSGVLKHLTATTTSDEYRFYPDSMLAKASTFNIANDGSGRFPETSSQDVDIKWFTAKDDWHATNPAGKNFNLFANGTSLDGSLNLKSEGLKGSGIIDMPDSRISSNLFAFSATTIRADTADYNLKSPSTNGYAFIADNTNADINFATRLSRFHLNTDSSVVKFPEIQYICTMTDFEYNQATRILSMEQKGLKGSGLMPADELLRVSLNAPEKPTFTATNNLSDTISFTSLNARYHVDEEFIEAENINYIRIADALIQPENGKITIKRRAEIDKLRNALVAVNNRHILHSADIAIESSKKYSGSALYDYIDDSKEIRKISFPEITVDTMATSAKGFIAPEDEFMLSSAFTFSGDVNLYSNSADLLFTGSAGIVNECEGIKSRPVKFKSFIDPKNVMIAISEKPRDPNDMILFSGSFINVDSLHIYPAFLSEQKSWTDVGLVNANGVLWYDKARSRYQISSKEKIADPLLSGEMVSFDRNLCTINGEGRLNFGANFDHVLMGSSGNFVHNTDSGKIELKAILGLDFFFSPEAMKMMSDEIRMMPTLKPVSLNSEFYVKGMNDLLGQSAASQIRQETGLFGASGSMPKEFTYELLLNDLTLYWNEASSSFRSKGKIGIGYIGGQPVNVYVDGFVDIQRRRTGDMIDIYLKADGSTWYYFSYFRGIMMAQAGNIEFNRLISSIRLRDRKHPEDTERKPYTYMIAVEDRLDRFLRRMAGTEEEEMGQMDGLVR